MDSGSSNGPKKQKSGSALAGLDYVALVDVVRKTRDEYKANCAFEEIEKRMQSRIRQISYKFNIPGSTFSDVYQEALIALRYKAIKDYDKDRGNGSGPYPFEKFAVLCIRRHLSTKLKACYQNKKKPWIGVVSLEENRNDSGDENLFLIDIVPHTIGTVLEALEKSEYRRNLFTRLFEKLSKREKEVLRLYIQKNSYEQIAVKIIEKMAVLKSEEERKVRFDKVLKSVDNALMRIKTKAQTIARKYGDE